MLAAAAERRHEAAGLDLADPRPAARARLAALVVDRQQVADLLLERRRDAVAQDVDRVGERRPRRGVQRVDLLRREASSACGTAAAAPRGGSRRCRRCRSRRRTPGSSAGSSARPGGAGSASRQTSRVSAGSSASGPSSSSVRPGTTRVDAGRHEVDLAHLGRVAIADLGGRVVGRHPAAPRRPLRRIARRRLSRGAEAQHDRGLRRQRRRPARRAGSGR